jgi:AI-2 transport protein TqsA
MALIVVIAVAPVQGWLRRHGWPGWATGLVVLVLVYAIMLGLALGIIISIGGSRPRCRSTRLRPTAWSAV